MLNSCYWFINTEPQVSPPALILALHVMPMTLWMIVMLRRGRGLLEIK